MLHSFKNFISLSKPGIIFGNLLALLGGYLLGSKGAFNTLIFLGSAIWISLVIGCAGVLNNIFDRDIDSVMERTQKRVLPQGLIDLRSAYIFGLFLGILGITLLALTTNILSVSLAIFGLFIYLVVYTLLLKRNSIHATLIGGLSGAVPPAVGYTAATNTFDLAALLLVLALCFWQMPHAYAIAIFRSKDFKRAQIPLFPLLKSAHHSILAMLFYGILFFIIVLLFPLLSFVSFNFMIVAGSISFLWILLLLQGFWSKQIEVWARRVFLFSILVITLFSLSFFI